MPLSLAACLAAFVSTAACKSRSSKTTEKTGIGGGGSGGSAGASVLGTGGQSASGGTGGAASAAELCDDIPADICASVRAMVAESSLAATPAVLWQSRIQYESLFDDAGVVVAGTKIVVPAGPVVHFFDKSGNLTAQWTDSMGARVGGVVADANGNVYGIGSALVGIDGSGATLWQLYLRKDDPQSQISSPFVLSPAGVLYAALNDGRVVAVTKDGKEVWDVDLGAASTGLLAPKVMAGFDSTLMVATPLAPFVPLSAGTGSVSADVRPVMSDVGTPVSTNPITFLRGFGSLVATTNGALEKVQVHIFDTQGAQRWSSRVQGWLSVDMRVTLDGRILLFRPASGRAESGPWQAVRCGCQQPTAVVPLVSSLAAAVPAFSLIGSDGTIYVGLRDETTDPNHPAFELVAHDPDFRVLWRQTFRDQRFKSAPIIDDDGVLYMVGQQLSYDLAGQWQQTYGQLVAVQTASRGLARTASAARRYDKGQTGWSP